MYFWQLSLQLKNHFFRHRIGSLSKYTLKLHLQIHGMCHIFNSRTNNSAEVRIMYSYYLVYYIVLNSTELSNWKSSSLKDCWLFLINWGGTRWDAYLELCMVMGIYVEKNNLETVPSDLSKHLNRLKKMSSSHLREVLTWQKVEKMGIEEKIVKKRMFRKKWNLRRKKLWQKTKSTEKYQLSSKHVNFVETERNFVETGRYSHTQWTFL